MLKRRENYAEILSRKLNNMGLNQRQFAELIGLGEGGERTVGGWLRKEHTPSPAKWELISSLPDNPPFKSPYGIDGAGAAFTFIDLFAGIGGIRLPFQKAGGHCVFTSEWDKFSKRTYAANYGEVPHGDITAIAAEEIPEHDVLLGGFPCQAFSQAGRRQGFMDTRGTMFFEIQRILAYHRPKAFLLENVKQLRGHDGGRTLETIMAILRGHNAPDIPEDVPMSDEARSSLGTKLDYDADCMVLSARNFGVPQNRERIYIIGFDRGKVPAAERRGLAREILEALAARTCKTRLGDVLENNLDVDPKYTISNRLWEGHKRRLVAHREKGNGFGYSLFRASDYYCNTISARYYKDGGEILIDQSDIGRNPRKLTPRECARIQGFPDEFELRVVSDVQNYRQFGNSVAIPVVQAIADEMAPYIRKK